MTSYTEQTCSTAPTLTEQTQTVRPYLFTEIGCQDDGDSTIYTDDPPVVTGISPDEGSEDGGTEITITGTGFEDGCIITDGGGVVFDDTIVVDDTTITTTTPPGTGGLVITITNPDGQDDSFAGGFTYVPASVEYTLYADYSAGAANLWLGAPSGDTFSNMRTSHVFPWVTASEGSATFNPTLDIDEGSAPNRWIGMDRHALRFDTSSIAAASVSGTVTVTVEFAGASDVNVSIGLYTYTPGVALPVGSVAPNDAFYDDLLSGSAALASDTVYAASAAQTPDTDLTFVLNAAGIAHIDEASNTHFSLLLTADFTNTPPVGSGGELDSIVYLYAPGDGAGSEPQLVVIA